MLLLVASMSLSIVLLGGESRPSYEVYTGWPFDRRAAVQRQSKTAAALGITSLERHITLNRAMYGSDQAVSVEPAGFRMLVGAVRKIEKAMVWLRAGKMNITEIAFALDFSSSQYFATVFKRYTGKRPSQVVAATGTVQRTVIGRLDDQDGGEGPAGWAQAQGGEQITAQVEQFGRGEKTFPPERKTITENLAQRIDAHGYLRPPQA